VTRPLENAPEASDVAVIGAGPAGLAAAIDAAALGLSVLLVDEQPGPGGQIYRSIKTTPVRERAVLQVVSGSVSVSDGAGTGGSAEAGTLIINPPGTCHSVEGEAGCIVLAIYEKAVRFLPDAFPTSIRVV